MVLTGGRFEVRRPGTYVMRHEKLIFTVTLRMLPPQPTANRSVLPDGQTMSIIRPVTVVHEYRLGVALHLLG